SPGGTRTPLWSNGMPRIKAPDLTQPLVLHFFYRRHGPIAKGVIGLSDTQIDEKIKNGELDPPVKAFEDGRATGWFGFKPIQIRKQGLARANGAATAEATAKAPALPRAVTHKRTKTAAKHSTSPLENAKPPPAGRAASRFGAGLQPGPNQHVT